MSGVRKAKFSVLLAVMLLVGLVVTGCSISMGLETKVNADGSGTLGLRVAVDEEMQQFLGQQGEDIDLFGELVGEAPPGWKVEQGTDPDGSKFVSMAGTFASVDELNKLLDEFGEAGDGLGIENVSITQEKSFLKTTTSYSATVDAGALFGGLGDMPGMDDEMMSPDMLAGIFQFENRVTLPGTIKANNGDSVQGNTVIWRPKTGVVQMTATSEITNWGPLIGIIAGAVFLVAVVVIVLLIVRSRKKQAAQAQFAAAGVPYQGGMAPPSAPPYAPPAGPVPPPPAPPHVPPTGVAPQAPPTAPVAPPTPEQMPAEAPPPPAATVPPVAAPEAPPAEAPPSEAASAEEDEPPKA